MKSLFNSYHIEFLFRFKLAKLVVQLHKKGSSTVSHTKVNILISLFGSSSGNIAICLSCLTQLKFQCQAKYSFHSSFDNFDCSFICFDGLGQSQGFLKIKINS
jgi:hypothetical protein